MRQQVGSVNPTSDHTLCLPAAPLPRLLPPPPPVPLDANALEDRLRRQALGFPLVAVVGQDGAKHALLLGAIDTQLGGIVIAGRRGTAKSVLARGIRALLPPIEVVDGSFCNADPNNPGEWEDGLAERLSECSTIPTRIIDAPFITVPLGATEDRVVGAVDAEASAAAGRPVFAPGLLAAAHRGVLYVDEINLLDDGLANLLLTTLADGVNVVEREGVSISHPCRPLLVATFNPDEGPLRPHLLDRIAVLVGAETPSEAEDRVTAVLAAEGFADAAGQVVDDTAAATEALRMGVIVARELLPSVAITPRQVQYLVEEACRARCEGHRAEVAAARVARASAALAGRVEVAPADLQAAVQLAIAPRATVEAGSGPPPPPPPPLQPPPPTGEQEQEEVEDEKKENEDQGEREQTEQVPEQFLFQAEAVALTPGLMRFTVLSRPRRSAAGRSKQKKIFSEDRGRYVKAIIPRPGARVRRLAVDATLRAAAPHQLYRRRRAAEAAQHPPDPAAKRRRIIQKPNGKNGSGGRPQRRVFIERDDLRAKRLARKAGRLVIFVVDASGSMALNRMAAAKGAALQLLSESYTCRDHVALVPFCGEKAEVALPPSRSIVLARRRLETMPCGGRTPLAHALSTAVRLGARAQAASDVGRVLVVLITDGRANVGLEQSAAAEGGKSGAGDGAAAAAPQTVLPWEELKDEVLDVSRKLGAAKMQLLVIDTESRFLSSGLASQVAAAAGGRYFHLPERSLTQAAVAEAASAALEEATELPQRGRRW